MNTLLLILLATNLVFSLLNLAILVPLARIAITFYQTYQSLADGDATEERGLVDVQPTINYHNILPSANLSPVDLESLDKI